MPVDADLAHVEIKGLAGAHHLGKRMGLERACEIKGQQVAVPAGKGSTGMPVLASR